MMVYSDGHGSSLVIVVVVLVFVVGLGSPEDPLCRIFTILDGVQKGKQTDANKSKPV